MQRRMRSEAQERRMRLRLCEWEGAGLGSDTASCATLLHCEEQKENVCVSGVVYSE